MHIPLPTCEPADKLAALFNQYIGELAPAADALAPRLSLRQCHMVSTSEAYQEAACWLYRLQIVTAGLVRLHECYIEATAILSDFADTFAGDLVAYEQGRGNLRAALAPLFANLDSNMEGIGAGSPGLIFSGSEWSQTSDKIAKGLGLPGIPRRVFGQQKPKATAHVGVECVLREGQRLAAEFMAIEDSAGYLQLFKRLTQVQKLKNMGILV
jgi:hypothetical protein